MGSNYSAGGSFGKYTVDIVMCIDATGSMGPLLDMVKANALNFYNDFMYKLEEKEKYAESVRVRIVAFRDYIADGTDAMLLSDFFNLPEQADEFEKLVRGITPFGGGDAPEDGLEALGYAIKSKWNREQGTKHRHVIVVWSDDATHDIGFGSKAPNYPAKMAKSFSELSEWWGCGNTQNSVMDRKSKRLLIYAPAKEYWTTIASTWDNALLFPSEAGAGLDDRTYSEILDSICGSI